MALAANTPTVPPLSSLVVPGRKRQPGTTPTWTLKLGTVLTTLSIFAVSFGYASTHLAVSEAPLRPAVVATAGTSEPAAPASSTGATATSSTRLASSVRTTTRSPVTKTASS